MRIGTLLKDEAFWTKNALGRDANGKPVSEFGTTYFSRTDKKGKIYFEEFRNVDRVKSFSLYGAAVRCYDEPSHRDEIMEKLRRAIELYTHKTYSVAGFNDAIDTTYKDIIQVVRLAEV